MIHGLGLSVRFHDTVEKLTGQFDVDGQALLDAGDDILLAPGRTYGAGFDAKIREGDLALATINARTEPKDLAAMRKELKAGDRYLLEIQIDKSKVLDATLGPRPTDLVRWFLYGTSVGQVVAGGIPEVEKLLAAQRPTPVMVVVGDSAVDRRGPLLHLVGADAVQPDLSPGLIAPADVEVIETMQRFGRAETSQGVSRPGLLTPLHTDLGDGSSASPIEKMLHSVTLALFLMWTADRVQSPAPDSVRAWYLGGSATIDVTLALDSGDTASATGRPPPVDVGSRAASALVEVVRWCFVRKDLDEYATWATQRVGFVRVRVCQLLGRTEPAQRAAALVVEAGSIQSSLRDQWRAFVEERIKGYLDERKQLDELVDTTVRSFGEYSGALTKSLIDTLLAAVAALIASAVAASTRSTFNESLFQLGLQVYAAYVFVFPGIIGLSVQISRYRAERDSYSDRRRRFAALLGHDEVEKLEGDRIRKAKKSFWSWLLVAVAGFLVAIIGALVAARLVPALVG